LPDYPYKYGQYSVTNLTWPPMVAFGWTQYWGVFAPEPREMQYHTTATITFEDGSTKLYEFPRTQMMSQWEKFCREKQRKLFGDNIPWPEHEQFRPAVARYLALSNANPANQPTQVTMEMYKSFVAQPDRSEWSYRNLFSAAPKKQWTYRDRIPKHTEKSVPYFVYKVAKKDVQVDPALRQSR
jgi:hypothetical protein